MKVECPNCLRMSEDKGRAATCSHCGSSPLPSYDYPKASAFYPGPKTVPVLTQLAEKLAARRGIPPKK